MFGFIFRQIIVCKSRNHVAEREQGLVDVASFFQAISFYSGLWYFFASSQVNQT